MSDLELMILHKSAVKYDLNKDGWVAFSGGDITMQASQAEKDAIHKLYLQGYVETNMSWGMNWYRVKVKKLIDIISILQNGDN